MEITWDDLKVDFTKVNTSGLLDSWIWLIGKDKMPLLISSLGDMFLADKSGACYWLSVGEGKLEQVANTVDEFKQLLKDDEVVDNWFLPALVQQIEENGLSLKSGKLYGFITIPVLGGEYSPENFELTDIEVHFHLNGQIHEQIKNLPEGSKIKNVSISQ